MALPRMSPVQVSWKALRVGYTANVAVFDSETCVCETHLHSSEVVPGRHNMDNDKMICQHSAIKDMEL